MLTELSRKRAFVLVVDIQEKLLPAIDRGGECLTAARKLLDGSQALGVPVLVSEQYPAGLGATCPAIASSLGVGVKPIEKLMFSACVPEMLKAIEQSGREQVVVCGVEAHVCVQQTVLDLLRHGREVWVCADAVGSRKRIDYETALERMRQAGAVVSTVESVLFEMLGSAGSEDFKKILRVVK